MLPERGPARLALWGVGALAVALVRNRLWASPNLAFFTTISDMFTTEPSRTEFTPEVIRRPRPNSKEVSSMYFSKPLILLSPGMPLYSIRIGIALSLSLPTPGRRPAVAS